MRQPARVALFVAVWTAINLVWLAVARLRAPLNIDEAGYFGYALHDAHAWQRGGLHAWIDQVLSPGVHAPLTSAVSSLGVLVLGPHPFVGFVVVVLAGAAALLVTAALGARVQTPAVMWTSLVIVASAPDLVSHSRTFVFAVPVTLVTVAALYGLVRSDHLRRLPWVLAFGVCAGLMPLTRTMTLAFVPGLALAALLVAVLGPSPWRSLRNGAIAAAVGVGVAALWLVPSWDMIWAYLTDYGYGRRSSSYAAADRSRIGSAIESLVNTTYVPMSVVLGVGWGLAAWYALRALRSGRESALRRLTDSPLFPCVVFVLAGCVALASSRNRGTGFALPLLPAGAIVAAWGWWRTWTALANRTARRFAIATIVIVPCLVFSGTVVTDTWATEPRHVDVPGVGSLVVTEGRGLDPAYFRARDGIRNDERWSDAWQRTSQRLLDQILTGPRPSVAFGFRGLFVNVNTVQLEALEKLHSPLAVTQIEPEIVHGRRRYRRWLTRGAAADSCFLLTSPGRVNEFTPLVQTATLERVATELAFVRAGGASMPDGRHVDVWRRSRTGC